jgi:ribosome-associated toxin RatA of RatAB toxin-antitoxin module
VARKHEEHQLVIGTSPQRCFNALTDYETFPEWQKAVKEVEVVTRDKQGRGAEVAFRIDAIVRTVGYRLQYHYEEPHRITWDYLGGDIKSVDGEYVFEDNGDGTTLATYALALDPGVWIPGPIAKRLREQVMQRSMEELKARVEG